MAVRVSRGFGRGQTTSSSMFPKMKYIKVTIFTDGIVIKPIDRTNNKSQYKNTIKFPKHMKDDVQRLISEIQWKHKGIFDVEVFTTIDLKLGTLAT